MPLITRNCTHIPLYVPQLGEQIVESTETIDPELLSTESEDFAEWSNSPRRDETEWSNSHRRDETAWSSAPPRDEITMLEEVDIIVKPDSERYFGTTEVDRLPACLLAESPFFVQKYKQNYREGHDCCFIDLPNIHPTLFGLYSSWLYIGTIDLYVIPTNNLTKKQVVYRRLLQLAGLAQYLGDIDFMDEVINNIFTWAILAVTDSMDYSESEDCIRSLDWAPIITFSAHLFRDIGFGIDDTEPILRLVRDVLIWNVDEAKVMEVLNSIQGNTRLMLAVARGYHAKNTGLLQEHPFLGKLGLNSCHYHNHWLKPGSSCVKGKKSRAYTLGVTDVYRTPSEEGSESSEGSLTFEEWREEDEREDQIEFDRCMSGDLRSNDTPMWSGNEEDENGA